MFRIFTYDSPRFVYWVVANAAFLSHFESFTASFAIEIPKMERRVTFKKSTVFTPFFKRNAAWKVALLFGKSVDK